MDDQMTHAYEAPKVVDYGDLQELTAACLGGSGGDAWTQAHHGFGKHFVGVSSPTYECHSKP
jgi:hypothetical protein